MILIVIVKVEKFKMHFDQTVGDFLNFYSFFWFRKKYAVNKTASTIHLYGLVAK